MFQYQPEMKVFAGTANRDLAQKICDYIGVPLGDATVTSFPDGETFIKINENIRGRDVFIVQPTCPPTNHNLMELLIMVDAASRSSAARITAVIPFFGYARQDRKDQPRVPITAKLVANLLVAAGVHRVLTMDLHAGQIQGFFDIPTDNLIAAPVFLKDIEAARAQNGDELVIVSPDVGGVVRARAIASRLGADLAIIDKRREKAGDSEVMNIIGEISGRRCILVDDIVDSAGTLCNAADALMQKGALAVEAYTTHGVLSGGAVARVTASPLQSLVTTDSIEATEEMMAAPNMRQLPIAPLLAEAILRIAENRSVSSLFV